MADVQHERAYQKQKGIYCGPKRVMAKKSKKGSKAVRWYRDIGLGFRTPKTAIEGKYIDDKCPFVGNVSIRGRILKGVVKTHKMKNTIIVRRDYLHYIKKYNRFEKRHSNTPAHLSPCFRVAEGDLVTIGECRPLSKTVRFNVISMVSKQSGEKGKQFSK
jgi:small subunit ribosomal protein S11e